ncbi:UNVERIFIED_CONTAM: hypothetical protein GTU68_000851 [Idotea baltica]|nr:hypothetical protein [Idotea baltica]
MSSQLGQLFRISTFGESHGGGVGVVIDGCPPRIPLTEADLQVDLDRRRPGQSEVTTPRNEADQAEILSGTFEGLTLGAPIAILVRNKDHRPEAYSEMAEKYRPSHADYAYDAKFGIRNWQGGGRSSARETIGRVAAAAVANQALAWVKTVQDVTADVDPLSVTSETIESNIVRTGDPEAAERMIERIKDIRGQGNSVGGTIEAVVRGCPPGLGEPVFDRLEADLAKAMLSIPATKGFEVGSGFGGTLLTGAEHNDHFYMDGEKVRTKTNVSGGAGRYFQAASSILFSVAFKPQRDMSRSLPSPRQENT